MQHAGGQPELDAVEECVTLLERLTAADRDPRGMPPRSDPAQARWDQAYAELQLCATALFGELSALCAIRIESDDSRETRRQLLALRDAGSSARLAALKSSAARSAQVYRQYLGDWLESALPERAAQHVDETMRRLTEPGGALARASEGLSEIAPSVARQLLALVRGGDVASARRILGDLQSRVEPLRLRLARLQHALWGLLDRRSGGEASA